jgi:tetratricopeptide (TPR) repeat protein
MTDWLRLILMIFYAPLRGMREVRDRGSLAPMVLCAYLSQVIYVFATQWLVGNRSLAAHPMLAGSYLFQAATSLLPILIVLVPLIALFANLFDRRGSFGIVIQQEYASLASVTLYTLIAVNVAMVLAGVIVHFTGLQEKLVNDMIRQSPQTIEMWRSMGASAELIAKQQELLKDPAAVAGGLFFGAKLILFTVGTVFAVREVFRPSILRAITIVALSASVVLMTAQVWGFLFSRVLASPFLLLMLFFLLRGYFSGVVNTQRARAAFKQNLEAATINPRDSSAHYNLGLIHQQRGELDQARERFHRAIDVDPEELDAHYQLGRIARTQNRLPEAISHFEEVVQRDQSHAQNEIWREIGSTYIAAGQYSDARDALEKFLDRRPNDPEGLYLIGRAHAGLGDNQEAASSMQACIEAVKTAPAYKYRTEKRWLQEAQQFLKGARRQPVGTRQ